MSWMHELYVTYENNRSLIGKKESESNNSLLPICHTFQNAHVQVSVDNLGNLLRASVVPKNESSTIIPCTENSAGRSGVRPECHPLCDSLQFIAGDFVKYGGVVTSGYSKNPNEPFKVFMERLEEWCDSNEYSHPKVKGIFTYLKKRTLIADLISKKVLYEHKGKLLLKTKEDLKEYFGSENDLPEIFRVLPIDNKNKTIDQSSALVRWCVECHGDAQSNIWSDSSVWSSWANYYSNKSMNKGFCYISGKESNLAVQHPKRIRKPNDNAKIISSNDSLGFTFRGRFVNAAQACGVSSEVTQKAHSALRWLISRQGYKNGDQVIVAWAPSGADIPRPLDDGYSILGGQDLKEEDSYADTTAQNLAIKLKMKIAGYKAKLDDAKGVIVMGLDSATPGRMAITFYRQLTGSDFLKRIDGWHSSCCWFHDYRFIEIVEGDKVKRKPFRFVGAPAPEDIVKAAYGNRVDDKLKKAAVERILPCIVDESKIPRDIVESAIRRVCNRAGMETWEWGKALSITCALYKKLNEKEGFIMALDENRKTRDYLYGRLLALADSLEQWALSKSGEDRQTNAARLMQRFADHPYSTWRTIELSLLPYKARLGAMSAKRQALIDKVKDMFVNVEDFTNDKKLSGEFLLAFSSQREALWNEKKKDEVKTNTKE